MVDRIHCLNPACRRTAAADRFDGATSITCANDSASSIVCAKCWKIVPAELRDRHRELRARDRKIARAVMKRAAKGLITNARVQYLWFLLEGRSVSNWHAIAIYFQQSPSPAGLEEFMKEAGLG